MSGQVFILLTVLCYMNVLGQEFNATFIPEGIDGANPVIAAVENATNVRLFCKVNRISNGEIRQTQWTLIRPGMTPMIIFFLANGSGNFGFEEVFFVADGPVTNSRTNLTILKFCNTFNNTQIGCGSGGEIAARFDLKLIGKF